MAITRGDFKQVPSSGIIPDERVPASQFAVGYAFTYTGYPNSGNFNQSFTGTIRLHVLRADDSVKYVIEIKQTYNLFIFPLAPGLLMYTWNWVPGAEQITGKKGDDPTDPGAPDMTTLGQGTFGVDPAEGYGTGNSEAIVISTFYSGIFTEPLDRGDKIKIVFHNLSAGFVVSRASLMLATELGGGILQSLFHAPTGQTFLLHLAGNELRLARTRRMRTGLYLRENPQGPQHGPDVICDYESTVYGIAPRYAGLHRYQGILYCDIQSNETVRIIRSTDDGETWEVVVIVPMENLNMNIAASALSSDGGTLYLYGSAAKNESGASLKSGDAMYAELKNEGKGWKLGARGKVGGEGLPTTDIAGLEYFNGILRLTAKDGDNNVQLLNSTDGLRTLKLLAIS